MVCKKLLLFFCFTLISAALVAQADAFVTANDLYNQAKYQEAIIQYESIVDQDEISEELYYNLANAYYQNDNLAQSILFYERTLRLDPNHSQALENLKIAKSSVSTEITKIPDFFLLKWWQGVSSFLGSLTWAIMGILLWTVAVFGFRKWLLKDEIKLKKSGFLIMVLGLTLGLICQFLAYTKYSLEHSKSDGIIMKESVLLKSAPDDRSKNVFTLGEGVKIKIVDKIENWIKVELEDREEGWIPAEAMEII